MGFHGENCEHSTPFVTVLWAAVWAISFLCFLYSFSALVKVVKKTKSWRSISVMTCLLISLALGSCATWAASLVYRCSNLKNQKFAEDYVAPVSITLFVTSTFTACVNISLVWIKLASNVLRFIAKERMSRLSNLVFCIGVCFLVAVFIILAVAQSYSGAAILTIFMAIFSAFAFLLGARLVAKKLKITPTTPKSTTCTLKKVPIATGTIETRKIVYRPPSNSAFPTVCALHTTGARANEPKTLRAAMNVVLPNIKLEIGPLQQKQDQEGQELSEGAKAIMGCAYCISVNCWSYCCASSFYIGFNQSVRFGMICGMGSVILAANAIFVNMLILKYLCAESLSYQMKENKIDISPSMEVIENRVSTSNKQ